MTGIIVVLSILFAACLVLFAVDFVFWLQDLFCRYHIGRWEKADWENAVENRAIRWLHRTPVVKITDNSRYMLLDIVQGKYRSQTIQSWQKAALILGLLESDREESRLQARKCASELIDGAGNWKQKPTKVDCGMLSYAVLKAAEDTARVRAAMDYSASLICKNINSEGMIAYTGGVENPDMYVDTIGLCCPFLCLYAKTYSLPEYEQIAFHQIEQYHKHGLLKETALPNHAFNIHNHLPLGVFGWGRGIGWYVLGLLDSYRNTSDTEHAGCLKRWIGEAAAYYLQFQRQDGGFGSIIQSSKTYDSSATAALAWFYASCAELFGREDYSVCAEKCLQKLLKCTRITGAIDWCQGDTKGIGIFAQTYDVMPFAQGMSLRAINLFNRK